MKIEQILYYVQIARTKSITTTAEQLHISQPSISVAVSDLESELGIKLFHRSRGGTVLTEQGAKLLPEAEKILQDWERLKTLANIENYSLKGGLFISCVPSMAFSFIPKLISDFKLSFPGIEIKIHNGGTNKIIKDITSGKSQLGFISCPTKNYPLSQNLYVSPLLFVSYVSTVARKSFVEKLDSRNLTLKEISKFPIYTFTSDYNAYSALNEKLKHYGSASLVMVENLELMQQLCLNGDGIGFLPSIILKNNVHIKSGEIQELTIADIKIARYIHMIHLRNAPLSKPMKEIINNAFELAKEFN